MNVVLFIIALSLLLLLIAFDFVIIPLMLKGILAWFGVSLAFWQCLAIVVFFNIITHSFRMKG